MEGNFTHLYIAGAALLLLVIFAIVNDYCRKTRNKHE